MPVVSSFFECVVTPDRDNVVVELAGELDLATAPDAGRAIAELIDVGFPSVTVDLTGLTFIDSSGLQMLLEAAHAAARCDCRLRLKPGPEGVQRTFVLTKVEPQFDWLRRH